MVNTFYKKFIEQKILGLSSSADSEKIIFYLKLYTNLLMCMDKLKTRRGFDHLKIIAYMTKQETFPGEAHYLEYINQISRKVIANQNKIQQELLKDPASDPYHTYTELLMAQNICVLRILKISKV